MNKISKDSSIRLMLRRCLSTVLLASAGGQKDGQKNREVEGINVLLMVARNYGLSYFYNKDTFELFGWNLVRTGSLDTIPACPPVAEQIGLKPIIPDISLINPLKSPRIKQNDIMIIIVTSKTFIPLLDTFE